MVDSRNIWSYLGKRALRIFPGLLVCLVLVVIACSFVYNGDGIYWTQKDPYTFILNNILLYPMQYNIAGVFESNVIHGVDGSLWTLAYEFTMYGLLLLLLFIPRRNTKIILTTAVIIGLLLKNTVFATSYKSLYICYLHVGLFSRFAQHFAIGVLLQILSLRNWTEKTRMIVLSICAIIFLLLCINPMNSSIFKPIAMLFLSIVFIIIGEMSCDRISDAIHKIGDLSYGTYIYAFPISQILIVLCNSAISPMCLTFLTILLVLPIAYLSWRCVEKPALALKKYL
jgi:peptidoglycan/LPS O-acetylase OafA/YrhL